MAAIFRDELGDMLLTTPVPRSSTENFEENGVAAANNDNILPSPEQLQGKIILKVSFCSQKYMLYACPKNKDELLQETLSSASFIFTQHKKNNVSRDIGNSTNDNEQARRGSSSSVVSRTPSLYSQAYRRFSESTPGVILSSSPKSQAQKWKISLSELPVAETLPNTPINEKCDVKIPDYYHSRVN